jgi:hypothetical protein
MDGYQAMRLDVALLNNSRLSRREIRNMLANIADFKANVFINGNSVEAAEGRLASGGVRGTPTRGAVSAVVAAILVSGCAAAYAPAPLPVSHPASPAALEAPPPPPSQAFRDESLLSVPAEEVPAPGLHSGHGTMPGGKNIPLTPVEKVPAPGPHSGHDTMPGGH